VSVSSSVTLPAQPAAGITTFVPLGGDGKLAPQGCYFSRLEVAGDASGGNASVIISFDARYTNLVAYVNPTIQADAGAGDFAVVLQDASVPTGAVQQIVGTIPQVAATVQTDNASFLWYPPPVYFQGNGLCQVTYPNVGVGETYKVTLEIYVFDINVRRLAALPLLQMNVPGVSAPAAV